MLRNHKNRTRRATAAKEPGEEFRGPEQPVDRDFNNKLDIIKAEFHLQFKELRDHVVEEMAKMTAQLTKELSQAREQLTQARNDLENTRSRRTPPTSIPTSASSTGRAATSEPAFCTVDMSGVPEEHIGEATPVALRKIIETEMRPPGDQAKWRCVAVTRDRGNINRLRIIGRNEEEVKKIKDIMEAKKAPGARVLRDQLYPVKVDNVNRTAVIDHEGKVLPGAAEALGQENEVQIAKMAWAAGRD